MEPVIISLEGNIAAGKTTLINALNQKTNGKIAVVKEDVHSWMTMGPNKDKDLLKLKYEDPYNYAFAFQVHAQTSRYQCVSELYHIEKERLKRNTSQVKYLIIERDIWSPLFTFAKLDIERGYYTDLHWDVLYKSSKALHEKYAAKLMIYLRTDPKICQVRMIQRNRDSERTVDLNYLEKLHKKHDKLFETALSVKGDICYNPDLDCYMTFIDASGNDVNQLADLVLSILTKFCIQNGFPCLDA